MVKKNTANTGTTINMIREDDDDERQEILNKGILNNQSNRINLFISHYFIKMDLSTLASSPAVAKYLI